MNSDGWSHARLGDLIDIRHGWPFKSQYFSEQLSGRPLVVNIGNFEYTGGFRFERTTVKEYRGNYPSEYELRPGEILLVMTCQTSGGEILGIPARVPDDGHVYLHNQRIGRVVIERPGLIDERYLYWLFLSSGFNHHLATTATGSKILHTSPSRIEAYRFLLPPLPQQRFIADTLDGLQDKIDLNRRIGRTLESVAEAIFRSWFVDFDPVRSKNEGGEVQLPSDLSALFPAEMDSSSIGPIPSGWGVVAIGDAVTVLGGSTPSTSESAYWGGSICFATPKDLADIDVPVLVRTARRITEEGASTISSGVLPAGTVLLSSRAPIGYLAISERPVCVNQGFIALVCDGLLPAMYALLWAQANMDAIVARANGTTFLEVSKRNFRPLPVLVPSIDVLRAFVDIVEPLHRRVVSCLRETIALAKARDILLRSLFEEGVLGTGRS
jgi:type I restriction enzyme, S subunit